MKIGTSKFQFPSSGKLLPNSTPSSVTPVRILLVSIPFKRETPTKHILLVREVNRAIRVSIPFKRETPTKHKHKSPPPAGLQEFQFPSSGKLLPNSVGGIYKHLSRGSFNSLQAGNSYQTTEGNGGAATHNDGFNSLQAGNSYQTRLGSNLLTSLRTCFNSLQAGNSYQTWVELLNLSRCLLCFNSLQAGNSYQTGSAHINTTVGTIAYFNSLQAGNSYQT